MYDYNQYESDSNDNSGNSGDDNGEPDLNLTITPYAPIEGDLVRVFGNSNAWGQSLGVAMENVELVDGVLYHDPEKGKHKVFNWEDVVGVMPSEENEVSADDANDFLVKNYGGTKKRYELVESIVMANGDDPVPIGNVIMWYGGSDQYGPKSASKTLAKILTTYGRDAVISEEDCVEEKWVHGWLSDDSGENILRPDLEGRRFGFFEVKKQSNQSDRKYHHPIVKDVATGAEVTVQNTSEGQQSTLEGTAGEGEAEPEAVTDGGPSAAPSAENESVPEAIEDFISTARTLGYDEDRNRAATLLTDLIGDAGNDLTANMVSEFGGEEAVLDEVTN